MDDATFSNMMDGQAQPFSFSLFDPTTSPVNGVNSNNNTEDPNASNDGNSASSSGQASNDGAAEALASADNAGNQAVNVGTTNNNNLDSSNNNVANILAQVIPAIMEVNKTERQAERTAVDQRMAAERQELLTQMRFNELRADSKDKHYVKDLSLSDKELVWDHKKEHFVTWGKRSTTTALSMVKLNDQGWIMVEAAPATA